MQRGGKGQPLPGKPSFVDIEGDVAVAYRYHTSGYAVGVGLVVHGRGRFAAGGGAEVGVNDASGLGAWQQGVVDSIHHVGDRLVAGKDQFVEHFARTAALGDLQLDPGLFLELCECFLGQTEGIMRHDTQRYLLLG